MKTLIGLGRCRGWSESSLGAQLLLLVLSCRGSFQYSNEQEHDKSNKMMCPMKTDQPGHLPSLIRVFAVSLKKICGYLITIWAYSEGSDQIGQTLILMWVFAMHKDLRSFCWFCLALAQLKKPPHIKTYKKTCCVLQILGSDLCICASDQIWWSFGCLVCPSFIKNSAIWLFL